MNVKIILINSKPMEDCSFVRAKCFSMGKNNFEKSPSIYYYGYILHSVCGLIRIIHFFCTYQGKRTWHSLFERCQCRILQQNFYT